VDGRYWLPAFQRTEFQATLAPLGSQRSVFRLISKFSDMTVDIDHAVSEREDSTRESARLSSNGSTVGPHGARRTLSYAKGDSVSRYESWQLPLGAATAAVSASDFNDFLPDAWRPYGPPRLEFAPTTFDQLFRFDRVEGAFSGVAIAMRFRDAAPGLSARVFGGWAWAEQAVRGGASVSYTRGNRTIAARAERLLVSTNDFGAPLDAGTIGFGGLFGADDQDYLDRRVAAVDLTNTIGSVHTAILTVDGGLGTDANERVRISHGLFGVGSFRLNRASTDGSYARGAATLELHPDVTGLFLGPGAGLVASYEIGRGELNWQRAELTLSARQNVRDLTIEGRAQGGMVLGRDIPPQQLFELGGEGALPGYQYKQFAGDRAGTGGALLSYTLPLLRRPWRLVRSLVVPGLGPGVAIGIQSGWAEASSERVLAAIRRLDPLAPPNCAANPIAGCPAPLSTPTGGVRSTVDARLTVFGGLLGFGLGRPIDRSARWRFVFRFGPEY
jgi:hypothetical protein